MKKILLLACACMTGVCAHALTLKSDGTIMSDKGQIIGYMKPNGAVEDAKHTFMGYLKNDGSIQDRRHELIGYLKRDGNMEDENHLFIKRAVGNMKEAALKQFFFGEQ